MIAVSIEDFYEKAAACAHLDRAGEIAAYRRMKDGDAAARQQLIESYLPLVAAHVCRSKTPTLGLALYCTAALERAVDSFDFSQESETFTHRLSWYLRQASVRYIVRREDAT